jgi:N-acetyl-gamma-glutamylphosphate reductase
MNIEQFIVYFMQRHTHRPEILRQLHQLRYTNAALTTPTTMQNKNGSVRT